MLFNLESCDQNAENPDYAPIMVNSPLAFEGLVVGLIRDGRTR